MAYKGYREAIEDLLACAYAYDDKPHLLYSCIRKIAMQYCGKDDGEELKEIVRLMDEAYEGSVARERRRKTW